MCLLTHPHRSCRGDCCAVSLFVGSRLRSPTRVRQQTSCGLCLLVASCMYAGTTGTAPLLMQPSHLAGVQQKLCWRRQGQAAAQSAAQHSRLSAHLPRLGLASRAQAASAPGVQSKKGGCEAVLSLYSCLGICARALLMRHQQQVGQARRDGQTVTDTGHRAAKRTADGAPVNPLCCASARFEVIHLCVCWCAVQGVLFGCLTNPPAMHFCRQVDMWLLGLTHSG